MPFVATTLVTFELHGDDLDPDELSASLGARPDLWARKGSVQQPERKRRKIVAQTGRWCFRVGAREGGDLDGQIRELFGLLTPDLAVWQGPVARYAPCLYVSVFTDTYNELLEVSPDCLVILAERGVKLSLDIYGSWDEDYYA